MHLFLVFAHRRETARETVCSWIVEQNPKLKRGANGMGQYGQNEGPTTFQGSGWRPDVTFCALMMLEIFGGMMFAVEPRAGKPYIK